MRTFFVLAIICMLAVSVSADGVLQANLRRALRTNTKTLVAQSGAASGSSSAPASSATCPINFNVTNVWNSVNAEAVGFINGGLGEITQLLGALGLPTSLGPAINGILNSLTQETFQLAYQVCGGCQSVAKTLLGLYNSLTPELVSAITQFTDLTTGGWTSICNAIVALIPKSLTSLIPAGINLCDVSFTSWIPAGCNAEVSQFFTATPSQICDVSGFWLCELLPPAGAAQGKSSSA